MANRCRARGLLVALVVFSLGACGELRDLPTAPTDDDDVDPTATLTRVQSEIFTPTCARAGCHDAVVAQAGLTLIAGSAHGELVNQPSTELPNMLRVKPSSAVESYLYKKVTGAAEVVGDRMPQGGPALTDAQIKLIRDWIRRGAPND